MIKTRILTQYVDDDGLQFGTFELPDDKAAIMTAFEIIGSSEVLSHERTNANDALNLVDSPIGIWRRDIDSGDSVGIPILPLLRANEGYITGATMDPVGVRDYYWDGNFYLPAGSSIRKIREDIQIRNIIITYIEIDS